jgi:hypothetical protein
MASALWQAMITFDPSISAGTILTFIGFVVGGLGVVYTMRAEVRGLLARMVDVEVELRKMSDVLVAIARQDERLNAVDRRLDSLEDND